jgi:hypothetical protein
MKMNPDKSRFKFSKLHSVNNAALSCTLTEHSYRYIDLNEFSKDETCHLSVTAALFQIEAN